MIEKKIIDVFLFYNELDLLELRFKILYDVVDFFVITEC
jgi:beta-1,4-mannosyl-glycoprotein beta-1,4-N-acetylglucosaminyltransferase